MGIWKLLQAMQERFRLKIQSIETLVNFLCHYLNERIVQGNR